MAALALPARDPPSYSGRKRIRFGKGKALGRAGKCWLSTEGEVGWGRVRRGSGEETEEQEQPEERKQKTNANSQEATAASLGARLP